MNSPRLVLVSGLASLLFLGCAHHRMHHGEGCRHGEQAGCEGGNHEGCKHDEGNHEGCKHKAGEPCEHHAHAVTAATEPVFLNSEEAAARNLPFSEAVRANGMLYLAGQLGTVPGKLELVPGGIEAESAQALENVRRVLERNGSEMRSVVKCTVFLADMKDWPAFNSVYRKYFQPPFPARSALAASGLALGAKVEIECMAVQ